MPRGAYDVSLTYAKRSLWRFFNTMPRGAHDVSSSFNFNLIFCYLFWWVNKIFQKLSVPKTVLQWRIWFRIFFSYIGSSKESFIYNVRKISRKTDISHHLACAYQGVRNMFLRKNFTKWMSPKWGTVQVI